MKKEKFVKVMNNNSVTDPLKVEIDEGYKQYYFGEYEGEKYEFAVYVSKTTDSKYKWQATEASTGFLICHGKTMVDCEDEIMLKRDTIYKGITGIDRSENFLKMLNLAKELVKNANLQ